METWLQYVDSAQTVHWTACVGVLIVVISSSASWVGRTSNTITGYGLNNEVSILGKRKDFSLQHRLQTGSGTHLIFFLIYCMEIVLKGKATGS